MPTSLRAFRTELSQAGVSAVNDSKSRRLKIKKQLANATTSSGMNDPMAFTTIAGFNETRNLGGLNEQMDSSK